MSLLKKYTQYIQNILGLPMTHNQDLIHYWISSVWQVSPTWNNLFVILRILNLDNLALQIESYLCGATENPSPIISTVISPARGIDGTKEVYFRDSYHSR